MPETVRRYRKALLGQRIRYKLLEWIMPGTRLDRLGSRASQAFAAVASVMDDSTDPLETRRKLENLIATYGELVWVFISICKVAWASARVPLIVEVQRREGEWEEATESDPLFRLLARPNPWQSKFDFVETFQTSMETAGESFIELDRGEFGTGPTRGMYVLPLWREDTMTVVRDPAVVTPDGPVLGYIYRVQGRQVPFVPSEIIHVKYANPFDPFRGFPPLRAGAMSLASNLQAKKYNLAFFKNSARPEGHWETDEDISRAKLKRLERFLDMRFKGAKNAHKSLLLRGVKWVSTQLSPKDMEFLQGQKLDRTEIIALFGVRPVVVGLLEDNPQANAEVQWRDFWEATMQPKHGKLTDKLNAELVTAPPFDRGPRRRIRADWKAIPILQEDFGKKVETAERLHRMNVPFNQINERLELGFDPLPWGDTVLVNPFLVPIEVAVSSRPGNGQNGNGGADKVIDVDAQIVRDPHALLDRKLNELQERLIEILPAAQARLLTTGVAGDLETRKAEAIDRFAERQSKWEKRFAPEIRRWIDLQGKRVLAAFRRETRAVAQIDLNKIFALKDEIEKMAEEVNRSVLRRTLLESMIFFVSDHGLDESDLNFTSDAVLQYITGESFRHAKHVNETTLDELRGQLSEAVNAGEGVGQVEERIKATFTNRASTAETIARTETVSASNFGQLEAGKQLGANSKAWLSQRNLRVRDQHRMMDFRTTTAPIGIGETFVFGDGSRLAHPGDRSLGADAGLIVNCVCTMLFFFDKTKPAPRTFKDQIDERMAQGFRSERDAREVGAIARQEVDRRVGEVRLRIQEELERAKRDAGQLERAMDDLQKRIIAAAAGGNEELLSELQRRLLSTSRSWGERSKRVRELAQQMAVGDREAVRNTLSEIRELGGPQPVWEAGSRRMARDLYEEASRLLPREWLEESHRASLTQPLRARVSGRGFYDPRNAVYAVSSSRGLASAIHELVHRIEHVMPEIVRFEREFYNRRTAGESPRWLGPGYGSEEMTRVDKFISPYIGRSNAISAGFYEVLSMGLEGLLTGSLDLREDEEMMDLILGLLVGVGR